MIEIFKRTLNFLHSNLTAINNAVFLCLLEGRILLTMETIHRNEYKVYLGVSSKFSALKSIILVIYKISFNLISYLTFKFGFLIQFSLLSV